ncbi:DNA ligase [Klebsiella phage KP13-7]|nr:DNA ligase [Klebsiella phage KP13-7]
MSILSILNEIKNTSSTNAKKDILRENKNNILLQKVIKYALDPLKVYGYKKLPEPVSDGFKMSLNDALDALDRIASREFTGHAGRDFIASVLGSVNEDDAEVLRKVLSKDLECGIQEKLCNDVFGKQFIKDEPYMRCGLLDSKSIRGIDFSKYGYAISELKCDGCYMNHSVINGSVTSTSRNGRTYDFLGIRDEEMNKLSDILKRLDTRFDSGCIFMGECLMLDEYGKIQDRKTGNGLIQKAMRGTISIAEAHNVLFVFWDIVPRTAFESGEWKVERKERRELLEKAIQELNSTYIRMVEYKKVTNLKEAFDYNTELMTRGEEGSVLKCESGYWKSHTSPKQLKMKLKMQVDLRIKGFNEGEGKRKGMLGSLILESDEGELEVSCGTGIKEKDEEWTFQTIWNNRDKLMGAIVTVETNDIIQDKRTNKPSLFLPVFQEFRFDKQTCDSYERILEIRESAVEVFSKQLIGSLK